uniref:Uncharacterized protein n=1 Tax=Arundo donax TaxID=35708 RepID=A0A0A9AGU3_ARUDO
MQCYLQTKGLDVWRVIESGMRTRAPNQERQYDSMMKSILLLFLSIEIFNRVYAHDNAHDIWTNLVEIHKDYKDVHNQRYHVLMSEFNEIKQLTDENANDMFSRLNVIVNKINGLYVKKLEDGEVVRKIIHSSRQA